ncbi:MAG: DUF58 domain-containing protein [Tetrasphaera sp.]
MAQARDGIRETWEATSEQREPVARVLHCVSPLGWGVLAGAVGCWVLAALFGWTEAAYAAVGLLVLFALSCLLTIGRTQLQVSLRVHPSRVASGDVAVAEIRVRNTGKAPLLPVPLEVPCGDTSTRFLVPGLAPGQDHDDVVVLPTQRRGVYPIGPAMTLRGDPFGIVRRTLSWTESSDFFVHPRTVFVEPFGTGVLRDLEGRTTNDVSLSDLAFHALREYQPGDDQRHIHWASTAKRSSVAGDTAFMVRQFLDTRRTHVGVVLDCDEASYANENEFETAVQAAASIARRAASDHVDLSEASGPFLLARTTGHSAIDLYSRVRLGDERVDLVAARLARRSPNMSTVVVVSGSRVDTRVFAKAASVFTSRVHAVMLQISPGAELARQRSAGRTLITIGSLSDLSRALVAGAPV